ncbi:DeoR/GlpR family DNA-binding transcription regulator [Cellulosimicrobium sp. Marseille-Q4280]|uniref:DeoR/GlpR family DNA-binding transcription regulator n=1 Tax=Cellulosimicrobium sp. Marseille-Q4280 TaxID=2937992 RepID=UPI002041B6B0|nr:DeoR/GlpR family DNA-binding transcription regulator [Cellulosimicrobium sp. Marseille-Q4280]
MLASERREHLLETLRRDGKIVAKAAAAELGLSEDSIRRDLRDLAAEGLCQRVYGGALPVSPAVVDYASRHQVGTVGKRLVAAAAVQLISPGATVILDGGTTALAVASALPPTLRCTVITHSPTVAAALVEHPGVEVFILGGRLFKHSAVASGAATVEAAQRISADVFLLGVTGIHPETGLTTGDGDEAAMKRVLAGRAAETYVLGSSEKIGAASPYRVIGFGDVAGIVTDADPGSDVVRRLGEQVRIVEAHA